MQITLKKISQAFALLFLLILPNLINAQKKITLEDIWQKNTFSTRTIPGFNFLKDDKYYSLRNGTRIEKYDLITGSKVNEIFNASLYEGQKGFTGKFSAYSFDAEEEQILLESETVPIYRHSTKSKFHLYDIKNSRFYQIAKGDLISHATFSPDGSRLAYVKANNLFYEDIKTGVITQITFDGKANEIINGMCDWVYEEEFSFTKAFEWNDDGNKIAFLRFDEKEVPEYTMQLYNNGPYPINETFKYPKVGEKNAIVDVLVFDLKKGTVKKCEVSLNEDYYIPRIKWTRDNDMLAITRLNRHQNHLELINYDVRKDKYYMLIDEKSKYFFEITDDLLFLENGKEFVWTSEKEGYTQIYLYDIRGQLIRKLTEGNYDVTSVIGYDEKKNKVYFKAAMESPMEHGVYEIGFNGKNLRQLSEKGGVTNATFSSNFEYCILNRSTANAPANYVLFDRSGKALRVLEENEKASQVQKDYGVNPIEFFNFKTSEGVVLNGWMIKPTNFNLNTKYPVFMTQYSGPGSQQVTDGWKGANYWWYQMLAQNGYLVACVDPRGTGARGEEFRKMTYMQLGHYETIDQIEAAKYLGSLSYVDANRIGIYGWSYGGYLSSLAILKGNDVFKAAIAIAPVTNWKWYDSVYTERYMRTYRENKEGYDQNSPVNFAHMLKGAYLICHGLADDNVHFQNTVEMTEALIQANKQFETYFYPNKNHGISGGNARLHLYTKMTNFIYKNL